MEQSNFYVRPHHASPHDTGDLQTREHVSGAELAECIEVYIRTVQRYIRRLQDLSIPVEPLGGLERFTGRGQACPAFIRTADQQPRLQTLSIMYAAIHDLEPERFVSTSQASEAISVQP